MHEHWTIMGHGMPLCIGKLQGFLMGSIDDDQNNFSRLEEAKFASPLGGSCGHLLVICPFLLHFLHFILLGYLIQQLLMVCHFLRQWEQRTIA